MQSAHIGVILGFGIFLGSCSQEQTGENAAQAGQTAARPDIVSCDKYVGLWKLGRALTANDMGGQSLLIQKDGTQYSLAVDGVWGGGKIYQMTCENGTLLEISSGSRVPMSETRGTITVQGTEFVRSE